ncbi:MAG TPA: Rrf2 family transcriptional regulator [Rhodocyclaceae bacterium]
MRINSRSRIAINAMLDVAEHGAHVPVALVTISERLGVSLSYLEQLFRRLRQHGLVRSARGPGGGYQLNKRLSAISVADIVSVVDEDGKSARASKRREVAAAFWERLDDHLIQYLGTITLDSVLQPADKSRPAAFAAPRERVLAAA